MYDLSGAGGIGSAEEAIVIFLRIVFHFALFSDIQVVSPKYVHLFPVY